MLAIITVVYQNYTVLEDFLTSLRKQSNRNFHLFITDNSKEKKHIDAGDIPLTVISGENKGYAYGVNLGLKVAQDKGFDLFCVMNNDTYFENGFVDNAIDTLRDNPHSIIGGKIYYAPGYEYHKNRYQPETIGKIIWYAGGKIDWNHVDASHRGVDEVDIQQYDKEQETDFITGCLMCFDQSVINTIGYWDEKYFLYYEDTDYCIRAQRKGVKLYYDPSLIIWHKNAQSYYYWIFVFIINAVRTEFN